jgi:hypothetical protein
MKYTKGDWFISGGYQIVAMPSQVKICNRVSGATAEEAESNKKLIASAPDMFEALQSIVDYWNTPQKGSMNDHIAYSIKLAESAIKKATK